ncbi:PREDICTED: sodium/potassium/calcium exchanger 3-like isoform X1 [Branchiostoma belcheri]|uniref:Sodium/potassium/calcium exchanger 3-like isoform X1 n=1 Tax=Branchiostoma belcheri TaxID=7741 RepID=A0A6P4Z8I9_BRABE|nr:PREDICTED: sodium/potassium/calcium exchanger 3-like isoform X1 [Branchiostoma belcheri]
MGRRTCDRPTAVHLSAQHVRQLLPTPARRVRRRKTTWQVSAAVFLVLWGVLGVVVALREAFDVERITRTVYTATGTGNLDAAPTNTSPVGNCSPPAIGRFPGDLFTQAQRRQGAVILHVIASLYMFMALAIICDDYFVPALERISEGLRLQPDVAGATFMAAGSSAPELFTSIFGVFISQDDIGVGTIVGSAVFNLLFIVGLCGLMVGTAITLTLWPLLRDCSIYLISVAALVIVMYDEQVHWYEACVLVCLYCLYVVLMYFNRQLSSEFSRRFPAATVDPQNRRQSGQYEKTPLMKAGFASEKTAEEGDAATDDQIWSSDIRKDRLSKFSAPRQTQEQNAAEEVQFLETPPSGAVTTHSDEAVGGEPESPFSVPSQPWRRVLWVVGLPLTALLWGTVPDCRRDRWRRWYPVSFLMSVVWIGVFTYILVWTVTVIGFTVGIPDTVMGLTLIAIGTSVPDAISSVLVSKEGEGDMAVSNAVGSNVFDILVGLGVPWLVRTAVVQTNSVVPIHSGGLVYSAVTLLSTVLVLLFIMWLNRWRLDRRLGVICSCLYAVFITLATLYELNVFGHFSLPTCLGN